MEVHVQPLILVHAIRVGLVATVLHRFARRHVKMVEPAQLQTFAPVTWVGPALFVKQHNAPHCVKMEPPVRV